MWIKVEEALPIQNFGVRVKNGNRVVDAVYYRKKWRSAYDYDVWADGQPRKVTLHKVTEWWKCPVVYPKIAEKDLNAFYQRAQKYKHQMQPKTMTFGPVIGLRD